MNEALQRVLFPMIEERLPPDELGELAQRHRRPPRLHRIRPDGSRYVAQTVPDALAE